MTTGGANGHTSQRLLKNTSLSLTFPKHVWEKKHLPFPAIKKHNNKPPSIISIHPKMRPCHVGVEKPQHSSSRKPSSRQSRRGGRRISPWRWHQTPRSDGAKVLPRVSREGERVNYHSHTIRVWCNILIFTYIWLFLMVKYDG